MDKGLFSKHIRNILERGSKKQQIINLISEKTGVILDESEIAISKKDVSFSTSSVKRATLLQKGSKELIKSVGMRLLP